MNVDIIRFTQEALWLMLILTAPPVLAAAFTGLIISFLQAITQIQEQTIPFAVKLAVVAIVLLLMAGVIGENLYQYTNRIFAHFPNLTQ
ncbi:type III secretory pathway needle complex export protein [Oleiphilus messinensis]|uniref:Type III secretory pathway needle complex export protein n=1 Tax=Oleiphilus messinensis TaxID=141451 RepID=A0A1Y0IJ76_9GAMM|nr:type III secretion system export apparatus subunit SctS [Oleiphilus messinensis]ARU59444.1 type III secretory pathway needle complex export protein [Oleiphilus messinensis]